MQLTDGTRTPLGLSKHLLPGGLGSSARGAGGLKQLGDPLVGQCLDRAGATTRRGQGHDVGSSGGGSLGRLWPAPVNGCSSMNRSVSR